jgi:Zn finger protein HypA/HybF involved in hydrogenase expression
MQCEECGETYEPVIDAYRCPVCGSENYPDDGDHDELAKRAR